MVPFLLFLSSCRESSRTQSPNTQAQVTNVILIIGDGMGFNQVFAFDDSSSAFRAFPHTAVVTTHSANNRVTDSAAGATALFTGEKTNNAWLGIAPDSTVLSNFAEKCTAAGISTGIVTLCSFTHATPAGFFAHSFSRHDTHTIVSQFADADIDVVITGGAKHIDPTGCGQSPMLDALKTRGYEVILNEYPDNIPDGCDKLVLMPYPGHFPAWNDSLRQPSSLARGMRTALEILGNRKERRFLLMAEESQIDFVCHDNDSEGLRAEMLEINKAMLVAKEFADTHPGTLVIVTADHETGGLSIHSADTDFTKSESGLVFCWGTVGHTQSAVPLFAYGCGAANFHGIMDNTQVHDMICRLMGI